MKHWAKKLLLWLGIPLAVFLLFSFVVVGFFGDQIGSLILGELKKRLKTPMACEKVELDLLWSFPNASVNLRDLYVVDATGQDTLLKAKTLSLSFGFWSIFSGNYDIHSVSIKDALLAVTVDKKGRANYDIWKEDPAGPAQDTASADHSGGGVAFSIQQGYLQRVRLIYIDEREDQEIAIRVDEANFSGDFGSDRFRLRSDAQLFCGYLSLDGDKYMERKSLAYDLEVAVDNVAGTYTLQDGEISVGKNVFAASGSIARLPNEAGALRFDLDLKGKDCDIGTLLSLLPSGTEEGLGGFESNADLNFMASIKGDYNKKRLPHITASMGLENGKVSHPKMNGKLRDVSFRLNFSNGENGQSKDAVLHLKDFRGTLEDNPIGMELKMQGLENPFIQFDFNGKLALEQIYGLLGESFTSGGGELDIEKLSLRGHLNDMTDPRGMARVEASGAVGLYQAALEQNGETMVVKNGRMALADNQFQISDLRIEGAGCDFAINGLFNNLIPVLFADSVNSGNALLDFEASLNAQNVDLDRLLKFFSSKEKQKARGNAKTEPGQPQDNQGNATVTLAQMLNGTFKAQIGKLRYGRMTADNFTGMLAFIDHKLLLKNVRVLAMGGSLELNSEIRLGTRPEMEMYFNTAELDISRALYEWEDFDQSVITHKNIKGRLNANILVRAFWDEKGQFRDDKLYALANVHLKNGELINVEMMKQLSKFVKVEDLERVVFSDLRNQFEIKNKTFVIPAMFIQSNAINLTVAGKQHFDNRFDYYFKVNAGQIFFDKFKKHNPKYAPKKAKKKGLFNMYVHAYGNLEKKEFNWKFDKKGVKAVIAADEQRQYDDIRRTLREEFGNIVIFEEPEELEDTPEYTQEWENDGEDGGGNDNDGGFLWDKKNQ
jgi:hypothetical protein